MYNVSSAFRTAMKNPVQEHRVTGTIGSISFTEANIVEGSFQISNQCSTMSDVVLGSCFVGQLTAEFTGINVNFGDWIGKVITPSFALKIGANQWESVPLGIFTIKEANHTAYGVKITAYDNMIKFDKKFKKSHFQFTAIGTYPFIQQICLDCGVICANTEQEIEAMPNGQRVLEIYGAMGKKKEFANDIETYRDLLFWVAQTMGCFATINRAGQLYFRRYTQTVVDEINEQYRLTGATFADYVTHYIGIYVDNLDTNTFDYYGYDATALQQELNECIEDANQIIDDMEEVQRKYDAHEITEEEYNAQMKALQKENKKLQKRMSWLEKALQQVDDGASMDLGANPLLCDSNLTTRDAERRSVLKSLDAISYTPFSASCVHGVIYDLGDVIQFSGGLYNSENDSFGCVMLWTYHLNGEVELQGFGVDPAVQLVRTKTQKSADRANTNAINAKESFNGFNEPQDEFPSGGKDGDIYIKRKVEKTPKITIVNNDKYWTNGFFTPHDDMYKVHAVIVDRDTGKYSVSTYGNAYLDHPGCNLCEGTPIVELHGFTKIGTYRFHIKANYTADYDGAHWGNNLGIAVLLNDTDVPTFPNPGSFSPILVPVGVALNVNLVQNTYYEYTCDFEINQRIFEQIQNGILYMYFPRLRCIENWNLSRFLRYNMQDFYIEYLDDGEPWYEEEEYIEDVYTYIKDDDESGQGQDTGRWVKIDYLAGADESSWSGLSVNEKKIVSLKDYVMRAWYKADPPQIDRDFSQFCVRYTGKPDTGITISYHGASGWAGNSLKVSDEGIYSIKCGGTRRSGEVDYVAYKIEGLVSNKRYYFNFAANIGDSATFGNDNTKGLGVLFNTTGSISSNDWSGEPHTFNNATLYESFYRNVKKHYYDFDFVATASTMYMIVTVADISAGITTSLSLVEFVVSQEERKYIREFYLYDFNVNEWLKYKPFGTKDDGSAEGVAYLSELNDVALDNLQDGQVLEYDANAGRWINTTSGGGVADYPDLTNKPSINSITLVGNKTSSDLGIVITLTQAQYDELSLAEKTDPNKVYYVSDAGGGGGGTGAEVLSDLDDVQFDNLSGGQVLQYDANVQKWKNANGYSLPTASANTLGGIKVGSRLSIDQNGVLSADEQTYSLPIASANTLGGIKVGNNLSIDQNGVLSATGGGGGGGSYTETELFSGNVSTVGNVTLSDNIGNYDEFVIWAGWSASNIGGMIPIRVSVAMFKTFTYVASPQTSTDHIFCYLYSTQYFRVARGSDDTKIYLFDNHSGAIKRVVGIKY